MSSSDSQKRYERDHVLSLRNVTKDYGDFRAVDDVSLEIRPGEIFALLGPNGAGKTTLISCITGLLTRFEGEIDVAGYDVREEPDMTRRLVGLVPQELNYDAFFSVREVMTYQGGYFGVPTDSDRVDELLEAFSLTDKADNNTRWLSGGMKRRLMICKALMHDPVLLFLDEPTAGVDVELREELWDYVRMLRERGTTIVLTTHYIEEAENLADRVGIINEGRLIRVDEREALMQEFGRRRVEARLVEPVDDELLESVRAGLEELEVERTGEESISIVFSQEAAHRKEERSPVQKLLDVLREHDVEIETIDAGRTSLEEIFKQLVFEDKEAM